MVELYSINDSKLRVQKPLETDFRIVKLLVERQRGKKREPIPNQKQKETKQTMHRKHEQAVPHRQWRILGKKEQLDMPEVRVKLAHLGKLGRLLQMTLQNKQSFSL